MAATYLKLFVDCLEKYEALNDNEFGRLVRAALLYKKTGQEAGNMGREALLWPGMRLDIDRDNEAYARTVKARSDAGKMGGRPKSNDKQKKQMLFQESKKSQDKEKDKDKEEEKDKDFSKENTKEKAGKPPSASRFTPQWTKRHAANPVIAAVVSDYLNRINPAASPTSLQELADYAEELGEAVCKRAFDIALDEKKSTWSYIRAILRDKAARGIKCLADWDEKCGSRGPVRQQEKNGTDRLREMIERGDFDDE